MKKINLGILGFGKVGQAIYHAVLEDEAFKNKFNIKLIWNRTASVFDPFQFAPGINIVNDLQYLPEQLKDVDLLIECAHPIVLKSWASKILNTTNLLISSPSALSDESLRDLIVDQLQRTTNQCYIPLGASVGIWDVIKLDQANQIKQLEITMHKHPDSFKITDQAILEKLKEIKHSSEAKVFIEDSVQAVNTIAPQNTNTMSIYALVTELGFNNCRGKLVANPNLAAHIVELNLLNHSGLSLQLTRNNPADQHAVTGKATFGSFLNSIYNYDQGIKHRNFIFC